MRFILINNEPVPVKEARVPVQDRGLRYGDGVFETIRVQAGVPYHFEWHIARLARGLKVLRIACDAETLAEPCARLLALNAVENGLLRIQVTRGEGGRGYLPDLNAAPTVIIETLPVPEMPREPVSLWLSTWRRVPATALPSDVKLTQGVNSTLARMEASDHGCFDALQLGDKDHIAETSSANIFWLKGDTLYTPALDCGIVEGSTRAALLTLSSYKMEETRAHIAALEKAEAVCIANAAWGVLAVKSLMPTGITWDSAPLARRLNEALTADIERECRSQQSRWRAQNRA